MQPDTSLMQGIHDRWGQVLATAAANTSLPESFLAALVANESGGNPQIERFEMQIFLHLIDVITGARASYGSIGRDDLIGYLNRNNPLNQLAKSLLGLRGLASSWGLTQIMGWQAFSLGVQPEAFLDPATNLRLATRLLASFAHSYGLDLTIDFEQLFRCWNTGRPDGQTFDSAYVPNGLARMQLYNQILAPAAPATVSPTPKEE